MLFEIVELIPAVWVECRILKADWEPSLETDLAIKRAGSVRFKYISLKQDGRFLADALASLLRAHSRPYDGGACCVASVVVFRTAILPRLALDRDRLLEVLFRLRLLLVLTD